MSNLEKYNNAFMAILNIKTEVINGKIDPESIPEWDSITHLRLVTTIEDEFNIMMESEDILDFKSYEKGKEILKKYEIEL